MQAPVIRKITLNMGVGEAKQDTKMLEAATEQLATIAGQRPSVRRARKSIAAFKLREGMPVGVSVTLRGERSYEFLDRLMSVAIPRIRDFRGMNPRSFDGRGNYSMGVREQIIFPEIDYDSIDQTRGMNITITTSAKTDAEAFALLEAFGFPFTRDEGGDAAAWRLAEERAEAAAAAAARSADTESAAVNGGPVVADDADVEPESAADVEPESAEDEEPEAAGDEEPEAIAEPEAAEEPEAIAEPEAAEEPEAVVEPETAAELEAEPELEPEPAAEAEAEAEAETAVEPAAEADADADAAAEPADEPSTTVEDGSEPVEAEAPRAGAPSDEAEAEHTTDDQEQ